MFSDKERESWQNIKARAQLFEKTKNRLEEVPPAKNTNYKKIFTSLVAASFVLIFTLAFFLIKNDSTARIYVGDTLLTEQKFTIPQESMMRVRALESSLALTLEIEGEADISTSDGAFSVASQDGDFTSLTSYKAEGKTLIEWTYPIPDDGECVTLTVKTENTTQKVLVEHDPETGLKNVTLIKNK